MNLDIEISLIVMNDPSSSPQDRGGEGILGGDDLRCNAQKERFFQPSGLFLAVRLRCACGAVE
jgi:hypothetical protein